MACSVEGFSIAIVCLIVLTFVVNVQTLVVDGQRMPEPVLFNTFASPCNSRRKVANSLSHDEEDDVKGHDGGADEGHDGGADGEIGG